MMRRLAYLLLLVPVACSIPLAQEKQPVQNLRIELLEPKVGPSLTKEPVDGVLQVSPASSSSFTTTERIVFRENDGIFRFYRYSFWTDDPTTQLINLVVDKVERARLFRHVVKASSGALTTHQLDLDVIDFYHDISEDPGFVVARIRATLLETQSKEVLATIVLEGTQDCKSFSAEGARDAFELLVNRLLDGLIQWLRSESDEAMVKSLSKK